MEKKLAHLLQLLAKAEIDIEEIRLSLAEVASPNLKEQTFELVDTNKRGIISTIELTRFFEKHKAQIEQDEVKMIIEYYDIKRQGKWDLETFHKAITPRTKPEASKKAKEGERKRLEDELVNFFLRELDLIRKTHNLRVQLHGTVATNNWSFYHVIDVEENGDFQFKDFDAFLVQQGLLPSRVELEAIMHRGARDSQTFMTYVEFERYILPNVVNKKVMAYNSEPEYMYNMVKENYRTEKAYDKNYPDKINSLSHYDPLWKYEQNPVLQSTLTGSTQPFTATNFSNSANYGFRQATTHYSSFTKENPRDNRFISGSEILSTTAASRAYTGVGEHHSAYNSTMKTTQALPLKYDKIYPHATKAEPYYRPASYYDRYPYSTPNYPETYYHGPSAPIREKSLAETYPVHMYGNHPHTIQPAVVLDVGYTPYTSYSKYESPMRFSQQFDATSARALNYKSQTSKPNSAFPISGPKPHYYYKVYDRFPADQYYMQKETNEIIAKHQPPSSPEKSGANAFYSPTKALNTQQPYVGSKVTNYLGSPSKTVYQSTFASPTSLKYAPSQSNYRTQTPNRDTSRKTGDYIPYNSRINSKIPLYPGSSEFSRDARDRRQSVNRMLLSSYDRTRTRSMSRF